MAGGKQQVDDAVHGIDLGEVFPFLSEDEVALVRPFLTLRDWAAGETLMRDTEPATFMGFVVNGKLAVKKAAIFPGKYTLMAILAPGSQVGETAAAQGGKRTATVIAIEDSRLVVLASDDLTKLAGSHPELGVKLLKHILYVTALRLGNTNDRLAGLL